RQRRSGHPPRRRAWDADLLACAARPADAFWRRTHSADRAAPRGGGRPARDGRAPRHGCMHGLILAGGEGARLAGEGVAVAKPLGRLGGGPLVVRLRGMLADIGGAALTVMVGDAFADVFTVLE